MQIGTMFVLLEGEGGREQKGVQGVGEGAEPLPLGARVAKEGPPQSQMTERLVD